MQKITFLVLLAVIGLTSASLGCCGREKKESKKAQKNAQSKLKLKVNFGENEVQPESVVKILEAVGGINWQKVGTSFAPVGQPASAPPTYVNINGRQVSAGDLAALLEVLNGVNWPQFSSSFAASGHGHPAGFSHSGHGHGHGNPSSSNPGSQKINIGGRDYDIAHVAQLLEHMGEIDWRNIEKSIEAANAGASHKSNSPAIGQNDLQHFAQLLERMGGIDWKKIESLVEASASQSNSGADNGHGNAGKNGVNMNEYMNEHMGGFNSANHPTTFAAASQPFESIPEEPEETHHHKPEKTHSAPEKAKGPQTNVQRLIEKWNKPPPLVEGPHFHCKDNCKHCQEDIFYGEEVSKPHVQDKIKRKSTVDWKSVGSK